MGIFKATATQEAIDRLEAELERNREEDRRRVDRGEMEQTEWGYTGKKS